MSQIIVEHNPTEEKLKQLGVASWSIWEKEVSKFPLDFGIKVDVDDLRESPFPEPSIVEVEYDPGREAGAAPIVAHLRAALAGRLRPKELNKIAYVLGGSSSPADPHHPESPQ